MADDERARFTVRLHSETADQLRSELSHFTTESARFQFLAQFYLDYKDTNALPAKVICEDCSETTPNHPAETDKPLAQEGEDEED